MEELIWRGVAPPLLQNHFDGIKGDLFWLGPCKAQEERVAEIVETTDPLFLGVDYAKFRS